MNYVIQLNSFFSYVKTDRRLTCSHVSLYTALFYYWNEARFKNPVTVSREKLMEFSKIKSKTNYYNSLKGLHQAGYIFCHLKDSPFHQVKVSMVKLGQIQEKNSLQLNVFEQENNPSACPINRTVNDDDPCPKNDTLPVLKIGQHCLNYRTATVLKIGHIYKVNNKTVNSVCKTLTKDSIKNSKKTEDKNQDAGGEKKSIQQDQDPPQTFPSQLEVETFFSENNYPAAESKKNNLDS